MINEPAQGLTGEGRVYEQDRRNRRRRLLLAGYAFCVALWLGSMIPLVRLSSDDGGGAVVAVVYLASGLAVALVTRGVFTMTTRRGFWSPWLFVIAAVLALTSYGIQTGGDEPFHPESAREGATHSA